jgi:hypothetical protein
MCDDGFDDFGWKDMALLGSLAEEFAEDNLKRLEFEQMDDEGEKSCCYEDKL